MKCRNCIYKNNCDIGNSKFSSLCSIYDNTDIEKGEKLLKLSYIVNKLQDFRSQSKIKAEYWNKECDDAIALIEELKIK